MKNDLLVNDTTLTRVEGLDVVGEKPCQVEEGGQFLDVTSHGGRSWIPQRGATEKSGPENKFNQNPKLPHPIEVLTQVVLGPVLRTEVFLRILLRVYCYLRECLGVFGSLSKKDRDSPGKT